MPAKRRQLAYGDTVASHDERFTLIESPHYLAAFVAEFPLSDFPGHIP